jgi:hypothetical protein
VAGTKQRNPGVWRTGGREAAPPLAASKATIAPIRRVFLRKARQFAEQVSSASEPAVGRNALATFQAPDLVRYDELAYRPGAGTSQKARPASSIVGSPVREGIG